jgi:hypothetical protein
VTPPATDEYPSGNAVQIEVRWSDGLHHRWTRNGGLWDLELSGVPGGEPLRISGYQRGDMERVLGTALSGTEPGTYWRPERNEQTGVQS